MARKVTIDVEARFIDNVSGEAKDASKAFDDVEKNAKDAAKAVDNLGKKKADPKVDADTTKATKKVSKIDRLLAKLGRSKTDAKLGVLDRASRIIEKVTSKAKSFASKTYSALLKVKDSKALSTLNSMSDKISSLTRKTFRIPVKILDYATRPLRAVKNALFSIKGLVAAITAGIAAKQFVLNPINVADAYSSAKIGFSTLMGDVAGQKMMNDLDAFAKKTPFNTTNVISSAQKMMAMGWNPEDIIGDLETLGNAAAATGNLNQGLESIVRAMSQIKTKGKLSTEELNQLAEAGIAAKAMLAEQLGYGTGDAGIAAMTKDLEKGAIASDQAIAALMAGMKKYDGMMDSMANETVEGLASQIGDAFDINVVRRWGQGLQDGAKKGFGTIIQLLDESEDGLAQLGDLLYGIGQSVSNWVADKFQKAVDKILTITDSYEFQNASLGGKISMLWNGVIADPLSEWWDNGGQQKTAETAGKIGSWIGEMLTKGLLALFGATDILKEGVGTDAGSSVAGSFLKGFLDNFDGSAITDALVNAISNVWGALPWWGKLLIGGYGVGKAASGIASFAGGIANFIGGAKNVIGGFNIASSAFPILTASGSGILGAVGKAGVGLGASTTGTALLMGGAGIAGGAIGGATVIKGGYDLYNAYKAHKDGDRIERDANLASGGSALAGVATGAAIGAFLGPLGALVGAGIGGLVGWIGGDAWADSIRAAKYESEEMKEAVGDSEKSAEELAEIFAKAKWENARKHFGDIKLSLSEIERLADQIVWGEDMAAYEKFTSSTNAATSALQSMKSASEQVDRWMWKAGLGVTLNEDEQGSFIKSFNDYVSSAQSYLENKHYEFAASADLLLNLESDHGKSILESGNAFYAAEMEKLNQAGEELGNALIEALKDGIISAEEEEVIIAAQQKVAEITNKIAQAEADAEIELIKVKWGDGNLDYESFETFMSSMETNLQERMTALDDAFEIQVANLKLRYPEGGAEYNQELQALVDGYNLQVEKIKADVLDVELNMIGDAYKDTLGADVVNDLNNVLQYAIYNGIDPIEISDEKMAQLLHINVDGNGETIGNLRDMLSGVFSQLDLFETDANLTFKVKSVQLDGDMEELLKQHIPESLDEEISVNLTATKNIKNNIELLATEFGIEDSKAATILWKLSGTKTIQNKIDVLCQEFGINTTEAETILWKLSGIMSIQNRFSLRAGDFGINSSYTFRPTININPTTGLVTPVQYTPSGQATEGSGYRGGIFGAESAMDAFARGGRTDNSGIVGGSTRYIRVNEESPEMIIPLSSQRRERALKLWHKTGELLNVPGFFRGGRSDGGADDWSHLKTGGSGSAPGGQTVHIDIGGITFQVQVDGGDPETIAAAIKEQAEDLAEMVAGIMNDAFTGQFENTPVRGGAA